MTERRVFFTADGSPEELEELSPSSDDREITNTFRTRLKTVLLSKIQRVRLLEGDTHFRILTADEKIVVPFGDGGEEATAGHYGAFVECLEGFEVSGAQKAGPWENLQFPMGSLIVIAAIGGLLGYFLTQDDFDYTGRRSGIASILYKIAHAMGVGGVSVVILAGVLGVGFWMYRRIRNPLKIFLATRA